MIEAKDYDIVGSYNNQRVSEISGERSINIFEYQDALGKKKKSLISTSGLTDSGSTFGGTTNGYRAQFVFNGYEYDVIGNSIFRIDPAGVVVPLFTNLNTSSGYVGVDANTFQVLFVDGDDGYIWDTTSNLFTKITDPSFPTHPIDCCVLDEFFIVAAGQTNTFQLSSFDQGLIWGPDNAGSESTFSMAASSSHIVITYATNGSINNYQIGTPVIFSGGSLPSELVAGTIYYVVGIISPTVITVSSNDGGTPITSIAGGSGSLTNNGQLQLGEISSHPGTIVACRTLHRRLFLFSQNFTEVWENAGSGTNLPFRRNNAYLIEYGTVSAASVATSFDVMFFLSQDKGGLGAVQKVSGVQAIPASTRSLDFQLAQYAALQQVSDCTAFLIKENGIIFYQMNFTAANHTFVYDVTQSNEESDATKYWHEKEVLNGDRDLAQTHAYFNGINYVGNYKSPIRYIVDSSVSTNDGEAIKRTRIGKEFVPEGYQRTRIDRFQLDLLQGNQSFIGVPPYVFLSISKDGGQTYGYRKRAPMGLIGNRTFRTLWRKLGVIPRGQAFVPKIEFYNDAPFIILGASWVYEVLPE